MTHRILFAASIVALAALQPALASAQPVGPPQDQLPASSANEADELYRKGKDAYAAGKFDEARALYAEAFSLKKSFDIAGNLGQVELQLGHNVAAAEHLAYSLSIFPPNGSSTIRAKTEQLLVEAKKGAASLRFQIDPERATVLVDGTEIGLSPFERELFVSPGARTVEVRKDGYKTEKRQLTAEAGKELQLSVSLKKEEGGGVATPPGGGSEAKPPDERPLWPPILLGGLAAVGLAAGVGLVVVSTSKRSEAEDCGAPTVACADAGDSLLSDANAMQGGGIASLAIGGASLIGMITYLALPNSDSSSAVVVPAAPGAKAGASLFMRF